MKLTYYGTGAGAGIPEMFCSCRVCEHARKHRGNNIRTRSQATIDDTISLDFPVDAFLHTLYGGLDMRRIRHIVFTHSHHDHYMMGDIFSRPVGYPSPLHAYATEATGASIARHIAADEEAYASGRRIRTSDFTVSLHTIAAGDPFPVGADYTFLPLRARHADNLQSVIYAIENHREGKHVLWAHDTGLLYDEVWEILAHYPAPFDLVSLDCTLGQGKCITAAHMDLDRCLATANRLKDMHLVEAETKIYLSHIGHLVERTHEEFCEDAASLGFGVAYDGLSVQV